METSTIGHLRQLSLCITEQSNDRRRQIGRAVESLCARLATGFLQTTNDHNKNAETLAEIDAHCSE